MITTVAANSHNFAHMNRPELSVIIPTLNEANTIGGTLANLACQQEISPEVIIVDGGSDDATREIAGAEWPGAIVLTGTAGRSRQLNRGAASARGEFLLFLHADSRFSSPRALRQGIDELRRAAGHGSSPRVAGRFSLVFARSSAAPSLGYRFFELKARLARPCCSHGDQGFLVPRPLFSREGPFDERCELLAQTRFADRLGAQGRWLLLTPEIVTSARRFETEGLSERQTINAVILACGAAGRDDLVAEIPVLYREQATCGRLATAPILARLGQRIDRLPADERHAFWHKVGNYVLENAWQGAFFLDVLLGLARPGRGIDGAPFLRFFDRYVFRRIDTRAGRSMARLLVTGWFRLKKSPPFRRNNPSETGGQHTVEG